MTTDDKYSRRNMPNFSRQLKTQFYKKQKTFFVFFITFLKVAWNLEHFEKKDQDLSLIISKIINSERGGYLNV